MSLSLNCFLMISVRLITLDKNTASMMLCPQCITSTTPSIGGDKLDLLGQHLSEFSIIKTTLFVIISHFGDPLNISC